MIDYSKRWLYDLDSIIARASGVNDEPEADKARALLRYFFSCTKAGGQPDVRVMKYLADAFEEFLNQNENGDLEKSLGLKRRTAGNPGALANKRKRSKRLTLDAREELRQEVKQRLRKRASHASIKKELSIMFDTSQDTVRTVIRDVERNPTGE
jgi:hypothetical protein